MAEPTVNQRARIEKAERFLSTARLLLRERDYESCVSRAYYALFHAACALVLDEQFELRRVSHVEIIRQVIRWNNARTRLRSVGSLGSRDTNLNQSLTVLLRWRNEADYELGTANAERAQDCVRFAEQMLQAIKEVIQ
ncbi:MAG: HEPN domain-containing protein [Dehalococcoidia bacterium]|nr:HEPN domain-containing protein [Dehalococcoidia bacterium]